MQCHQAGGTGRVNGEGWTPEIKEVREPVGQHGLATSSGGALRSMHISFDAVSRMQEYVLHGYGIGVLRANLAPVFAEGTDKHSDVCATNLIHTVTG